MTLLYGIAHVSVSRSVVCVSVYDSGVSGTFSGANSSIGLPEVLFAGHRLLEPSLVQCGHPLSLVMQKLKFLPIV